MPKDIEKLSDGNFVNREGDVLPADDVITEEDMDPSSAQYMQTSSERADVIMRVKKPFLTVEDFEMADKLFVNEQDRDLNPGVSLSMKKRAKALTRIAQQYEAHENLSKMADDAKSFKVNPFNQAYSKKQMRQRLDDARDEFADSKDAFDDDLSYLAKVKHLKNHGFSQDDLTILHASRIDMRGEIEKLRKGGELAHDRLVIINKIRTNVGLEPIEPNIPDHLKIVHANKPTSSVEKESGCDCNCQVCDNGGGLHCHKERTNCFM